MTLVKGVMARQGRQGASTTANLLLQQLPHLYASDAKAAKRAAQRDLRELVDEQHSEVLASRGRELQYVPAGFQSLPASQRMLRDITREHLRDLIQDSMLKRSLEKLWPELLNPSRDEGVALGEDKLRIVSDTQRLIAAEFREDVLAAVLEAFAVSRSLVMQYRDAKGDASTREVHPLGLLQRGPRVYLWAWRPGTEDSLRMYAMHRVISATLGDASAQPMPGFSLQERIEKGQADFASGESIELVLRVRGYVADVLRDCPLSETQRIEEEDEGSDFDARVYATLPSTGQLLRWLLGGGDKIEVLAPLALRGVLAAQTAKMTALYAPAEKTQVNEAVTALGD